MMFMIIHKEKKAETVQMTINLLKVNEEKVCI